MKKIINIILFLSIILFLLPKTNASPSTNNGDDEDILIKNKYYEVLNNWQEKGLKDNIPFSAVISPNEFVYESIDGKLEEDNLYIQYLNDNLLEAKSNGEVFIFNNENKDATFSFNVLVEKEGLYKLGLDYYSLNESIGDLNLEIKINDKVQYYEASQISLDTFWETKGEIKKDRFNNDIMPTASQVYKWSLDFFKDSQKLYEEAILFKLDEGINEISIKKTSGDFKVGQVYIKNLDDYMMYDEYLNSHQNKKIISEELIKTEAETVDYKTSVSIRYETDRNPTNKPFGLIEARLNVLDGSTYKKSGQTIYYQVEVENSGLYQLSFKALATKENSKVFRTIYIDGKIPFKEALRISFDYSGWKNQTVKDKDGKPYLFYLEKGIHEIGFSVNSAPYREIYHQVDFVMKGVNQLALDIKKLTANQIDENRDWDIIDFLPNIGNDLNYYGSLIEDSYNSYKEITNIKKDAEISSGLKAAYRWLYDLAKKPNDVPKNINKLTGPTASVLQRLGIVLPLIIDSPLTFDAFYFHGEKTKLPKASPNFFENIWYEIKRFFASFFSNQYSIKKDADELNIWVNRSRQYVNLMQQMADEGFTNETGIKVNISLMPNEDKLILAASSNTQPDLAMGVAGWRPYDFAIRGALLDLSTLDGFDELTTDFKQGSFVQLIYQDGIYGFPETQNFNILFYRKDILNTLNLEVPDTWEDVINMLPELQRFGMNYYSMLSSTTAFKSFSTTMPFMMQFGADLYSDDVNKATLDEDEVIKAMTLMTDLFTVYALPLEVGSFYNQFRYGNIPVGIGDFGMYIQLLFAAPEISGLWGVAPLPGIRNEHGEVDRSYDGASTSSMIFKNSKKPDEAWKFLQWWMDYNTQLNYAENLIAAYGPEYMWNTANVNAFSLMNINDDDKEVFLEQWNYVFDTAKTPASYMLEREISNAWNRIVYDGINVRTAMEDANVVVNKEINRKMIEFGFINEKGEILKEYILPKKDNIGRWVK